MNRIPVRFRSDQRHAGRYYTSADLVGLRPAEAAELHRAGKVQVCDAEGKALSAEASAKALEEALQVAVKAAGGFEPSAVKAPAEGSQDAPQAPASRPASGGRGARS